MNIYHQLIENPLFFKWIYHPSTEINDYWDHFLKEHPEDKKIILEFKASFQKNLNIKTRELTSVEKKELAFQILKKLEIQDKKRKNAKVIRLYLRYAAIAILFLSVGSTFSYLIMKQRIVKEIALRVPDSKMNNILEPTLIIENEQEITLAQGESRVDYTNSGEIKVDNNVIHSKQKENKTSKLNTLVIPYGNRSTITLSDGTIVILNAGSRLIYPSRFVDKKREVFLVGEAFFDVEKNEEKPFIVKTPDVEIEVLGTKFNLSAYPEDNIIQTVLTEGHVEINFTNPGLFDHSVELKPGQLANVNRSEKITNVYKVDTEYYTSWTNGFYSFQNTDLSRVAKKLERYFNVRIFYDDPLNGTVKISGKLDVSKSKEEVFEYMTKLTGLKFTKINERSYQIN